MSRLLTIWNHIRRHKYLITIVAFLVMIVFLDENSLIQRAQHQQEINDTVCRLNGLLTTMSNARTGLLFASILAPAASKVELTIKIE